MESVEFLDKLNKNKEILEKYNFLGEFYNFVKFTMTTGCNCKKGQKQKLIEERYETLKRTSPPEIWRQMEADLND